MVFVNAKYMDSAGFCLPVDEKGDGEDITIPCVCVESAAAEVR